MTKPTDIIITKCSKDKKARLKRNILTTSDDQDLLLPSIAAGAI